MTKVTSIGGRRSKHSANVERELVRLLRCGNTRTAAARACGIHEATLRTWCRLSARFRSVIDQAEAEAETLMVNAIVTAAVAGDWGAAKFWLTHQRSDAWRPPPERQEVGVDQRVIIERVDFRTVELVQAPAPPALPAGERSP